MATKQEVGEALRRAHEAGDTEGARALAQAYASMPDDIQPQPQQTSALDYAKNAALGFAARGNEAMAALNPWADQQKIEAEREWVKRHKGADFGETLADVAITAPIGGVGGALSRIAATGLTEAATRTGDNEARAKEGLYGTIGAGFGESAAKGLGFLARPFKPVINDATSRLVKKAGELGIDLNAAQTTGNRTLQTLEKALNYIPSTSSAQAEKKLAQRDAWQKALFKQGGEDASLATQDVMGLMEGRLSDSYRDIAGRNTISVDQQLKDALDAIAHDRNMNLMDVNKKPIIQQYLNEFNSAPVGSTMSASGYQNQRSLLDKQAKSFKHTNPVESISLAKIRTALDDAMGRSVSPADREGLLKANNDWAVMKSIEKAIDPATANISPNLLINHLKSKDAKRVIYGKGNQDLADIAKVGKEFIPDKMTSSNTSEIGSMIKALTSPTAAFASSAGGGALLSNDPTTSIEAGAAGLLASILAPKAAQKMLWSPNGYLSKGLINMNKEVLPDMTRQKLLAELLRNSGTQLSIEGNQ